MKFQRTFPLTMIAAIATLLVAVILTPVALVTDTTLVFAAPLLLALLFALVGLLLIAIDELGR